MIVVFVLFVQFGKFVDEIIVGGLFVGQQDQIFFFYFLGVFMGEKFGESFCILVGVLQLWYVIVLVVRYFDYQGFDIVERLNGFDLCFIIGVYQECYQKSEQVKFCGYGFRLFWL